MRSPYFHARRSSAGVRARGEERVELGHRLPGSGDGPDDGVFAAWQWDGRRLEASNDRYGLFPVYYYATPREVGISTSLLRLLALGAPAELDDDALAVFLRLGFFVGGDTPFRAIRALPPRARFSWAGGEPKVEGGRPSIVARQLGRAAAVDGFVTLFRQAIERRPPAEPRFVLPLSGGRDSRHILFELLRAGWSPEACVSSSKYSAGDRDDPRIAAQVARAAGVEHRVVPPPRDRLRAELAAAPRQSLCSLEGAWLLGLARHLGEHTRTTYDGLGGDVLSQSRYLTPGPCRLYADGRFAELAGELLAESGREPFLEELLGAERHARSGRERAVARLVEELSTHADAPCPISSFFFWNRTRRQTALGPYALFGRIPRVFSPYLDHDLFDHLASLPTGMLLARDLHTETLRRAFPEYAHLGFAGDLSGRRRAAELWRRLHYLRSLRGYRAGPSGLPAGDRVARFLRRDGLLSRLRHAHRLVPVLLYCAQLDLVADAPAEAERLTTELDEAAGGGRRG